MPRKQKKYHFIYKTTNLVNGKYYVGMHSTDDLEDGYIGSGKRLWYSINKHGRENHKLEILEFVDDRITLALRESEIVNEELLKDPQCMNLKFGGEGGWDSINESYPSELRRQNGIVGGQLNGGKNILKANNSKSRAKAVATKRERGTMFTSTFSGQTHSEETRMKMSSSHTGTNNSQFGTKWICNEHTAMKIHASELEEFLLKGWQQGRKFKTRMP